MIVNALNQVADKFGIKKFYRQFHEFNQKVGYQEYIYPCSQVQQYPVPDKIYCHATYDDDKPCNEHQVYECNVTEDDAFIHQCLKKEWEKNLKHAAEYHS